MYIHIICTKVHGFQNIRELKKSKLIMSNKQQDFISSHIIRIFFI